MALSEAQERVLAKAALAEIATRYARAIDRRDREMLLSCYHPDAIDHHGTMFRDGPVAYADWQPQVMAPFAVTAHYILNTDYRIDGARAQGEIYFIAFHREADGGRHVWVGGRYCDDYEERNGEWRISHRTIVWDFVESRAAAEADAGFLATLGDVGSGADDASIARLALFAGAGR